MERRPDAIPRIGCRKIFSHWANLVHHTGSLMLTAAWHLLVAACRLPFGSPWVVGLAGLMSLAIVLVVPLVLRRGTSFRAMTANWLEIFGWAFGSLLLFWAIIIQWSVIGIIYEDHLAAEALNQRRLHETNALGAELAAAHSAITDLRAKLAKDAAEPGTTVSGPPSISSTQRDPDALYQLGEAVAKVSGTQIDRDHGIVWFARLTANGYYNLNRSAEFGGLTLQSCHSEAKSVEVSGDNVTSQAYLGVVCQISDHRR
jgi:hypothetical protein